MKAEVQFTGRVASHPSDRAAMDGAHALFTLPLSDLRESFLIVFAYRPKISAAAPQPLPSFGVRVRRHAEVIA